MGAEPSFISLCRKQSWNEAMNEQKSVYIVDDEPAICRAVSFALKASGFHVRTWPNPVAFLKELGDLPTGCILADVRMPGMNGLEMLAALKLDNVKMPVILMTGHGDVDIMARSMKDGAFDLLAKPFTRSMLLATVVAAFEELVSGQCPSHNEATSHSS
jgi:two-component system, LuxR family, response regulator FixJ